MSRTSEQKRIGIRFVRGYKSKWAVAQRFPLAGYIRKHNGKWAVCDDKAAWLAFIGK